LKAYVPHIWAGVSAKADATIVGDLFSLKWMSVWEAELALA
jgi:hypothetical protein